MKPPLKMAPSTKPDQVAVHIRCLIRRDYPQVLQIERDSYAAPWTQEDFVRCLRARDQIGRVAEIGDTIVGFSLYGRRRNFIEILNLTVAPACRRRGIGRQLVGELIKKQKLLRVTVRESNLPALQFLRNQGFLATELIRGLYEDTNEDAIEMWHDGVVAEAIAGTAQEQQP